MKELKILAVVASLVLVTFYGIEPYAHHVMHPEGKPADFKFSDLKNVDTSLKGDVTAGKESFVNNCTACHSLTADGFDPMMSDADSAAAYGVTPPDLSLAGRIYEKNFLANFIFDPVTATKVEHKYPANGSKVYPMPAYSWMGAQEIMNIVAYLESVSPKAIDEAGLASLAAKEERTLFDVSREQNAEVFKSACGRCHDMKYGGLSATTPKVTIQGYMGSTPPDLSQYIISRGSHYLDGFINNPQEYLHGTGMPRVGLSEQAQAEVIEYMTQVGDPKKTEREELGPKVLLYLLIFAILAYLWKRKIWSEVH
ncbi:MAG: c-type cytochrome [Helicobacteraceae bacterium]|nr:c-type cytochrome [Helicobacteraceae bacterium]